MKPIMLVKSAQQNARDAAQSNDLDSALELEAVRCPIQRYASQCFCRPK